MGVRRKNIYSDPRPLNIRKMNHARVQKVQTAQRVIRKEIPVDAASLRHLHIPDGVPRTPGRDLPASPVSSDIPLTLGHLTPASPAEDSDEDMDDFDEHELTPVNNVVVTSAAAELEEKAQAFEEKVSQLYPFLLQPLNVITDNCWVLDTGCCYGLSGGTSVFVAMKPNSDYIFTFG